MEIKDSLTFNDVLMVPKYSKIVSRKDVDVSVAIKGRKFAFPIVPANMKTISGFDMCKFFIDNKSLAITHRFNGYKYQLDMFDRLNKPTDYFSVSVGVKPEDYKFVDEAYESGVRIFTVDVAHGHSQQCGSMCYYIWKKCKDILLIAGNVATKAGARYLWDKNVDVVKVGIGNSGICSTRLNTGCGVPQLTALLDIAEEASANYHYIMADGGMSTFGHIGLALSVADITMSGNMFAGTDETPGDVIDVDGVKYKRYDGSSTHKTDNVEGIRALVKSKGSVADRMKLIVENLQSTCSYNGVSNLYDLKNAVTYVKLTNAGIIESGHHSIDKIVL